MSNEVSLTKVSNYFVPQIEKQLRKSALDMTPYQKMCVTGAMQQMYQVMIDNDMDPNEVRNNISDILLTVAALQLNANAEPREIYFQTRNSKDRQGKWHKQIEMGIEGDGNDALLSRFGRNVAYVHPFWLVREGDKFEFPKHMGIELTPPIWEPTGDTDKKVIRVVYPIDMYVGPDRGDGDRPTTTEYFITERQQVKNNLLAHMSNNVMREKDKFDRLKKIKEFAKDHTLDEILDSSEMIHLGKISPAWREPQSRETMIIRKMRNNVVKKIPKDFNNGLVQLKYEEATNDSLKQMRKDVTEEANSEDFDKAVENNASEKPAPKEQPKSGEPEIIDKKQESDSNESCESEPSQPAPTTEGEPF
ncbi:hypothetical protein [Lentilactobacillus kisonensis]|uniref:RecT family protein n=1 Tax=Lentilactobacillus kisonensis DSM 19906 = JCM 15041 TaxID=1423766 RepID=A0A0R1NN55_9LACO|nr:hypothetical protein [Lentilactobacillus kisonensis]KRL21879.1 hypothetical protein FC98_GL000434 [Lentilactobacillus kisonensis DSM 19906 = JCM 15041]